MAAGEGRLFNILFVSGVGSVTNYMEKKMNFDSYIIPYTKIDMGINFNVKGKTMKPLEEKILMTLEWAKIS